MKKVVVTYAGRKKFLEILFEYILKYKHHFDEYHIYAQTDVKEDLDFINDFYNKNTDFVKVIHKEDYGLRNPALVDPEKRELYSHSYDIPNLDLWNIAWKNCQDENTVYLRLDDDIVYVDETLFTDFLDFRIKNPQYPLIYPVIINNSTSNWILQKYMNIKYRETTHYYDKWSTAKDHVKNYITNLGRIPDRITDVVPEFLILCEKGWGDILFCIDLHEKFLDKLENGEISDYRFSKNGESGFLLESNPPMSINCISWLGKNMKEYTKKYGDIYQEEPWVSVYLPVLTNSPNFVYFGSVVSHFAFYRQIEMGLLSTNILERYKKISEKICKKLETSTL
jgi:hypothetical protein